jgi:hypothetical protein
MKNNPKYLDTADLVRETATAHKIRKVEGQKLTIGLDLGDRSSWYSLLEEAGEDRRRTPVRVLAD